MLVLEDGKHSPRGKRQQPVLKGFKEVTAERAGEQPEKRPPRRLVAGAFVLVGGGERSVHAFLLLIASRMGATGVSPVSCLPGRPCIQLNKGLN